jgi:hypothetical protein
VAESPEDKVIGRKDYLAWGVFHYCMAADGSCCLARFAESPKPDSTPPRLLRLLVEEKFVGAFLLCKTPLLPNRL